jgi:5'-nucleotidase
MNVSSLTGLSFPFEDPVIVIKVTGKGLLHAIENSVSAYPALEGRFPQVSSIEFEFDPNLPKMSRVKYVKIGAEPLDLDRMYTLVTRGYMGRGKDGFTSLLVKPEGGDCEEIVSEENGLLISTILRQYFLSLKVLEKWNRWSPSLTRTWDAVHDEFHDHHPVVEPLHHAKHGTAIRGSETPLNESDDDDDQEPAFHIVAQERKLELARKVLRKWRRLAGLNDAQLCDELGEGEFHVNWTKVSISVQKLICTKREYSPSVSRRRTGNFWRAKP